MTIKGISCSEIRSDIYLHARQTKQLIWEDLSRGACEQHDGLLTLRSDGTGTWTCTTTSRNEYEGDVWHTDFAVRDQRGVTLFGIGPFYSPRMNTPETSRECRWSASFSFSADMFSTIYAAVQNCGCLPPAHALRQAARREVVIGDEWSRTGMVSALEAAHA